MAFKKLPYLFLLFSILAFSQNVDRNKDIYLDSNDRVVTQKEFRSQWSNKARWDYINEQGNRVNTLHDTVFIVFEAEYEILKNKIESITTKRIPPNSRILIEYYFLNDLCASSKSDNNWTKYRIRKRKNFLKSYKEELEKNSDIFVVFLFEEGIKLNSNPEKESEYFYTDQNNYFRDSIFLNPTLCGSFALIKPSGEILVRNGENRIDMFNDFAEENWNLFFRN